MTTLNVSVNAAAGQKKLEELLRAVKPNIILTTIGGRLISFVQNQFNTAGRGKWPPLAESTVRLGGEAPLRRTGRYMQSWVVDTDHQTWVEVGSNLKVKTKSGPRSLASIHEFGTGPYTIKARMKKVLAAKTREGDWLIFGKEVHHPGIPKRPVLPDWREAEKLASDVVIGMLEAAKRNAEDTNLGRD